MPFVERTGYTVLASGASSVDQGHIANIIFVHGLRGHPRTTWEYVEKKNASPLAKRIKRPKSDDAKVESHSAQQGHSGGGVFWPADLLPNTIKNAKIMTYGYDADVIGGPLQGASKTTITQHGQDLMVQLEREVASTEPIIFVAHGLCGIIVREGLHWAKTRREGKYQALNKRVKHIVFLGTPHRGSEMASMGKLVANFAAVALQDSNKALLKSLSVDSEILDKVHYPFADMLHSNDFTVHLFQEGRGVSGVKPLSGKASHRLTLLHPQASHADEYIEQVVNDFSSKLDHPLEIVERIDANHMELARFASASDPGFRKLSGVLQGYIAQIEQDRDVSQVPLSSGRNRRFNVDQLPTQFFTGRHRELQCLSDLLEPLSHKTAQRRVHGKLGCGRVEVPVLVSESSSGQLPAQDLPSQQRVIDAVKQYFTNHDSGDWLLVVDNADDLKEINVEAFTLQILKGSVIIASRNRQAQGFGSAIELGELSAEDEQCLLLKRSGIQTPTTAEKKNAASIAKSLGYLALALEHAGAYIQSVDGDLDDYQELYKSDRRTLLSETYGVSKDNQSVFATFDLSFRTISRRNVAAAKLLSFLSFLDCGCVQETVILDKNAGVVTSETTIFRNYSEYMAARRELIAFSLIRIETGNGISMAHSATTTLYIHTMRFCEQATTVLLESMANDTRQAFWCRMVHLMSQYEMHWLIYGAMGDLYRYCKTTIEALEKGKSEQELLHCGAATNAIIEREEAFNPIVLTDVFVIVASSSHSQLIGQLNNAALNYAGRKCWHQASLFSRFAELPPVFKDDDEHEQMNVSQLLISAARDAEAGDSTSVCDKYRTIVHSPSLLANAPAKMLQAVAFDYSQF
ncbi:MAG: hypothetical protein M1837_004809 [Sclerophora amabilis]|nr:MAG: hypothetical protein M1837_004809 [Sclerophora amabilis]